MRPVQIAPSILSADFFNLGDDIRVIENGGGDLVHIDVMDGHFVPNITIGPLIVKAIRPHTKLPLDVHLMIENPGDYIDDFVSAGADIITVHVEACPHLHRVLQAIKAHGIKAGVVLNPHTPISSIEEVLGDIDMVLLMTVNPGFGGQKFIEKGLDKITRMRKMLDAAGRQDVPIEIDGGVKLENIAAAYAAGAEIIVSGSGIYKSENPVEMIGKMKAVCTSAVMND